MFPAGPIKSAHKGDSCGEAALKSTQIARAKSELGQPGAQGNDGR